jgi:hypothetical protein
LAVDGPQSQYCIPVQGKSATVSGLRGARIQPGDTSIEVDYVDLGYRGHDVNDVTVGRGVT